MRLQRYQPNFLRTGGVWLDNAWFPKPSRSRAAVPPSGVAQSDEVPGDVSENRADDNDIGSRNIATSSGSPTEVHAEGSVEVVGLSTSSTAQPTLTQPLWLRLQQKRTNDAAEGERANRNCVDPNWSILDFARTLNERRSAEELVEGAQNALWPARTALEGRRL